MAQSFRKDIQGLRAIAVVAVMLFHAFPALVPGGFLGVDVFFVISGFLITNILLDKKSGFWSGLQEFYADRVRRIMPALLVLLCVLLGAGLLLMQPQELKRLAQGVIASFLSVSNLYFWRHSDYFADIAGAQPLLHTWSLAIEAQFYLLYPLLLIPLRNRPRAQVQVIVGLAALLSLALCLWLSQTHPKANFFMLPGRAWELLAGGWLAAWQRRDEGTAGASPRSLSMHGGLLAGLGIATLIACFALMDGAWNLPGVGTLAPVAATVAVIHGGRIAWGPAYRVLSMPVPNWLGRVSYSLYLWHHPLLAFARLEFGPVLRTEVLLVLLGVSLGLAWASWRFVETPFRRRSTRPRWIASPRIVAFAAVILVTSSWVQLRDGLISSATESQRDLVNYAYDFSKDYGIGECFLTEADPPRAFGSCETSGARPGYRVLLWGDSHAAHLRPGFERMTGLYGTMKQRAASGCAPLLGRFQMSSHCRQVNLWIWDEMLRWRPEQVVLAAQWHEQESPALAATIEALREAGVQRVTVVGPTPRWRGGLPGWLALESPQRQGLPRRLRPQQFEQQLDLSSRLRSVTTAAGADYADAMTAMCGPGPDCAVTLDGTTATVLYWDDGHLTRSGSLYLMEQLDLGAARNGSTAWR